jgi:uncharacterized protein (UPF0335 family)
MAGNPILHELPPFSLRYPPSLSPGQRQTIYEGQVRAFLEASKDVEIEEEVLNDILDGFGGLDEAGDDMAASETIVHSQKGRHVDAAENIELPLSYGFYIFFGPQEPMTPRWAKQQINGMVAHLKQRGEYSSCRLRQR